MVRATVYGHTGVVGRVLYEYLQGLEGLDVGGVSLEGETPGADDCEWAFVCVPTLTVDGEQDQGPLCDVLRRTRARNVVIRSTVLPGTCAWIQAIHPDWTVYHWPEFLSARTAAADFAHPHTQVVGCADSQPWVETWEWRLPIGERLTQYVDLSTAEVIKYAHNCHGAMEVIFANLLYDACARSGAQFEGVRQVVPLLGYVGRSLVSTYWNVHQDDQRGYAGACFPKDVQALAGWLGERGELLQGMERANARLRGER